MILQSGMLMGLLGLTSTQQIKKKTLKEGTKVRAAGWGVTEEGQISQILKSAQVEVQPNETCASLFRAYQEETQLSILAILAMVTLVGLFLWRSVGAKNLLV